MKEVLRQRMYHLVLYNISPIQQGIQAYHAGIEYSLNHGKTKEYKQWATQDKVVIILNGGTSNNINPDMELGSMEKHVDSLGDAEIRYSSFFEPDLNSAMTAIAFLVDERVWDKVKYPDPERIMIGGKEYSDNLFQEAMISLYGKEVAFLRKFLSPFRLA